MSVLVVQTNTLLGLVYEAFYVERQVDGYGQQGLVIVTM